MVTMGLVDPFNHNYESQAENNASKFYSTNLT